MSGWGGSSGDATCGGAASGVSTVGLNEEQIRQYVRWQEKKEREEERLQGKLFEQREE